jgi:cytochrome c biogenesis protein ResB
MQEITARMPEKKTRSLAVPLRRLASLKLTVILLLLLGMLVISGTIYQAGSGIYAAQHDVFGSWLILLYGVIPLPGMLLVSSLLFVNLLAAAAFRLHYRWRGAGLLLIHYGLLLLIGGGFFISVSAEEYSLTLGEGESSRFAQSTRAGGSITLPIAIKLLDFQKTMHPGTEIPRSFSSRIEIAGKGIRRQAVIAMNRPLRYRSYAFYQSSYAEDGRGGESSTFSVVRSSGRWLPYLASALLFLGLAWHFLVMLASALKKAAAPGKQS